MSISASSPICIQALLWNIMKTVKGNKQQSHAPDSKLNLRQWLCNFYRIIITLLWRNVWHWLWVVTTTRKGHLNGPAIAFGKNTTYLTIWSRLPLCCFFPCSSVMLLIGITPKPKPRWNPYMQTRQGEPWPRWCNWFPVPPTVPGWSEDSGTLCCVPIHVRKSRKCKFTRSFSWWHAPGVG